MQLAFISCKSAALTIEFKPVLWQPIWFIANQLSLLPYYKSL